MKRLWPILMPSLILFLPTWILIILLASVEEADCTENSYIKVSVSQESLRQVPSCIPEISWVELVNTHPTNTIAILGIDTIEIDVPNDQQHRFFEINPDGFPLSLSPGQTEYKPLIFLPRDNDLATTTTFKDGPSNNDIHQIIAHNAIVRVITSEGTVYSPFKALSVLSNSYGLPNGLHFRGKLRSIVNYNQDRRNKGLEVNEMRWEYDIFLRNPSDTKLYIYEIFPSEPDWIKIQLLDDLIGDIIGPPEILPGQIMYIGTVVVYSSEVISSLNSRHDKEDYINDSILLGGYLHIRTNLDELVMPIDLKLSGVVVAIEAERARARKKVGATVGNTGNSITIQARNDDEVHTQNLKDSSTNKDDEKITIDTSNQKIVNNTEFAITYKQEDFHFPTLLSVSTSLKNIAKDDQIRKQQGFNLIPNAFRRKNIQTDATNNELIEHILSFTNNCSVPLTLSSIELSSPQCSQWFELRNHNYFEGLDAEPGEVWKSPGRDLSLVYFGNFTDDVPTPFKSCSLALTTDVFTHEIPITLYGNEILITAETSTLPPLCQISPDKNGNKYMDIRNCSAQWWDTASSISRVKSSLSHDIGSLPLTLNFGAIAAGEISVRSLMLTNPNPIPVKVLSDKSSLEGMEISLGRTSARVADYIPSSERQFWNHPFFPELGWKNDVKFSDDIDENLRDSFIKYGAIELFKEANKPSLNFYSSNNNTRALGNQEGGVMLSLDGQYRKKLATSSNQEQKSWSIPPGAVARFDVYVHAPPSEVLEKDITSFVASGVVLETATTTLELLVTFDTLLGKLELTPNFNQQSDSPLISDTNNSSNHFFEPSKKTLHIPAYFRPFNASKFDPVSNTDGSGIELVLSSSFTSDLKLDHLESCNKWFSVSSINDLINNAIPVRALERSLPIGHIFSSITCRNNNFYSCAVEWLQNSNSIQPPGCGLGSKISGIDEALNLFLNDSRENILLQLKEAEHFVSSLYSSNTSDINSKISTRKGRTSPLTKSSISNIDKAKKAWHQISKLNLNRVSTEISAKTFHGNKQSDSTPTSVPALFADTELILPSINALVNSTLDFTVNSISSYNYKYITVHNPTAVPLRVGIASAETPDIFVQYSADSTHSWWTINNYWMPDGKGNVLQSNHNLTIKNAGGTFVTLVNPSLNSKNSFSSGCGKQCGLRNEANVVEKGHIVIGASAAQGSLSAKDNDYPAPFALGRRGLAEADVPPFGKAKLGPLYFRPAQRTEYVSEIFLQNSLTGLERVIIKGIGGLEKISFLHEDVEQRIGRPTLVFTGNNESMKKDLSLTNFGDIAVEIRNIYIATSEITNYASSRKPTRSDIHTTKTNAYSQSCEEHGFRLVGCISSKDKFTNLSDSSLFPDLKHGLILEPGQNRKISVQYTPDCTFGTVYVSLNVEYRTHDVSNDNVNDLQIKKMDLLMGFDKNENAQEKCFSSKSNALTQQQRLSESFAWILSFMYILIIIHSFMYRYYHSRKFREKASQSNEKEFYDCQESASSLKPTPSISHFHCLIKSNPTSQELIALGKEQAKKVLVSRYSKLSISTELSQCVQFEIDAGREEELHVNNATVGPMKKISSLSDVIYGTYDENSLKEFVPSGLGWRFRTKEAWIPSLKNCDNFLEDLDLDDVGNVRELIMRRKAKGNLDFISESTNLKKKVPDKHSGGSFNVSCAENEKDLDTENSNQVSSMPPVIKKQPKFDTNESKLSEPFVLVNADEKSIQSGMNTNDTKVNFDDIQTSKTSPRAYTKSEMKDSKELHEKERTDVEIDLRSLSSHKKGSDASRKKHQKLQNQFKPASKTGQAAVKMRVEQSKELNGKNIPSRPNSFAETHKSNKKDQYSKRLAHSNNENKSNRQPQQNEVKPQHVGNSTSKQNMPLKKREDFDTHSKINSTPISIVEKDKGGKLKSPNEKDQKINGSSKTVNRSVVITKKKPAVDEKEFKLLTPSRLDDQRNNSEISDPGAHIASESSQSPPTSPMRPPPGLLPPPGFTSESNDPKEDNEVIKTNQVSYDAIDINIPPSPDLGVSILKKADDAPQSPSYNPENLYQFNQPLIGRSQPSFLSGNQNLITPSDLMQNKNAVSAIGSERSNMGSELIMSSNDTTFDAMQSNITQLGLEGGFDIDSYLSNILNESSVVKDESIVESSGIGDALPMGRTHTPRNPWESSLRDPLTSITEKKYEGSRASAYGIDVEKSFTVEDSSANLNQNRTSSTSENISGNFLDPKDDSDQLDEIVYLKTEVTRSGEEEDDNMDNLDEDFLDGDSFIVSLVGE